MNLRRIGTLMRRELAAYFLSPIAYMVMVFFLFVMGFSFWLLVLALEQAPMDLTVMQLFFGWFFYWMALLVLVPVITMRLYAEEKRSGTIEVLMTAPVSEAEVVVSKYLGSLLFFIVMWLPTLSYMFLLRTFCRDTTPIDPGPIFGGYLGTFLIGGFLLAIGNLVSTWTRNQIIAAIFTFALVMVWFSIGLIGYFITPGGPFGELLQNLSSVDHILEFARGIIDTRRVVLYLAGVAFLLLATTKSLEAGKWR